MIDDRNLKHALILLGKHMWAPCLRKLVCLEGIMGRYTPSAHEPSSYHILKQVKRGPVSKFSFQQRSEESLLTLFPEPICHIVLK